MVIIEFWVVVVEGWVVMVRRFMYFCEVKFVLGWVLGRVEFSGFGYL